ncbi:type 1 glutamine amidotransferase [Planococcus sp. SE5232]|uniref:type 1 glutamine amidotransferase n=1 Tax=unclassified Planococcus (in: firmicutes) TaxID=2662419 RepID=UPI003D6C1F0A
MKILIVQPDQVASPGETIAALEQQGIDYELMEMESETDLLQRALQFEAMVILGGVMGANDEDAFPFLKAIKETIRLFHEQNKPIFGICLGAQLIASAFGGKVEKMGTTEFGITELTQTAEAENDPVFNVLPLHFRFMEWHEDRFDLPDSATLLASSALYPNQAFRIKDNIYAIQFHPEVNEQLIKQWVAEKKDDISEINPSFIPALELEVLPALAVSTPYYRQMISAWLKRSSATSK